MEKQTIIIPDGCKAEIRTENGMTVIVVEQKEKKRWRAKEYEEYYNATFDIPSGLFLPQTVTEINHPNNNDNYRRGNYFRTEAECQAFCDKLNKTIAPIL